MKLLGMLGSFVNGWLKLIVALVVIVCFNLGIVPGSNEPAVNQAVISAEVPAESSSVASDLALEIVSLGDDVAGNQFAQLIAVLLIGLTSGVALRPKVDRWRESHAVRAARQRAERHAADLRLLAAEDAKSNVRGSGKNVQTVKYAK